MRNILTRFHKSISCHRYLLFLKTDANTRRYFLNPRELFYFYLEKYIRVRETVRHSMSIIHYGERHSNGTVSGVLFTSHECHPSTLRVVFPETALGIYLKCKERHSGDKIIITYTRTN